MGTLKRSMLVRKSYRDLLRSSLGKDYDSSIKSYEVLGSIAVIGEGGKKGRAIAQSIMQVNKGVKTVLRKAGAVKGKYRKRAFALVAGKRNYIAEYRENGSVFRFDVRKTFFSPRLAYERKRIVDLSKDGENVVVMFAGVGPFAIEIARKNRRSVVTAIELNKDSYRYMLENIKINKTSNVNAALGDANRAEEVVEGLADRVIMPLPMKAHEFLSTAMMISKDKGVIHYYAFGDSEDPFSEGIKLVKGCADANGRSARIINKRVVRPYSSRSVEVAIDFTVSKKKGQVIR